MMGQGFISRFPRFRMIGCTMMGQGYISRLIPKKKKELVTLNLSSKRNKDLLFKIYQSCINQKWKDFFNATPYNFINGYLHDYHSFFFRDVFVNNQLNSFILFFNRPFFSNATVEMYTASNFVFSILDELIETLNKRGISYINIKLFNFNSDFSSWSKEKGLEMLRFVNMGKTL